MATKMKKSSATTSRKTRQPRASSSAEPKVASSKDESASTPSEAIAPPLAADITPTGAMVTAAESTSIKKTSKRGSKTSAPAKSISAKSTASRSSSPQSTASSRIAAKKSSGDKSSVSKTKASSATTPKTTAIKTAVRVFQSYHEAWQKELVENMFTGVRVSAQQLELPELTLHQEVLKSKAIEQVGLWGITTWRYSQQFELSPNQLLKTVRDNAGFDVYHINTHTVNEGVYHNSWFEGETKYPGLMEYASMLLKESGHKVEVLSELHTSAHYMTADLVIATSSFWQEFVGFMQSITQTAAGLDVEIKRKLMEKIKEENSHTGRTCLLSQILMRMAPVFIELRGSQFKVFKINHPVQQLNVHQKLLREMKDLAISTKSNWMIACWINYRNLYVNQVFGKKWAQENVSKISPREIVFEPIQSS